MRGFFLFPIAFAFSGGSNVKPAVVEIIGTDYAFRAPATLTAGPKTFRFRNAGKQRHEFNLFLLKPGVTVDQVIAAGKAGKLQTPMIEGGVGVLFADPGSNAPSGLTVNLVPGRDYGVQCIFRDSTGRPRHYEMGMYSVIHVTGPAVRATIPADSVVGVDYAFARYPREVTPGMRTLAFRNAGKHRHEISVALLKKGITLDSVIAVDKRDGDVDPLFEENGGLGILHAMPDHAALGGLSIDFLPGREYLIDCSFSDDDKSPPHYKLGMYGSIRVRKRS